MKKTILLLLGVTTCGLIGAQTTKNLPQDVQLMTLDSTMVSSATIPSPGKITMVVLWNSMMRPAFAELDSLALVYDRWQKDYGVEIVALTWEYPGKSDNLPRFLAKRHYRFRLLQDTEKRFVLAAHINSFPTTFILDKTGNIAFSKSGFDPPTDVRLFENKIREISRE